MSFQSSKAKSAAKIALPKSEKLSAKVLYTLKKTADIVGSTLGPFGQQVLIERPEHGLKPFVTKDGVTVHKNIGYEDSVEQVVLEASRDAAVRTAQEAGDGTTTSTILSSAIAQKINEETRKNKKFPPQRIIREINNLIPEIESEVQSLSTPVDSENYDTQLHKVATLSANGDEKMADVIMEAFDLVGDQGNITITEEYGLPAYKVEKFNGFTIGKGYEESCTKYYPVFVNDQAGSRIYLEKPIYLLFDGNISDLASIAHAISLIDANREEYPEVKNIILFAHSFSDSFLSALAYNYSQPDTFKIVPMKTEQSIVMNSQTQFLYDLAAFTGAKVFNPMSSPVNQASVGDLVRGTSDAFESSRFRSTIIGMPDPTSVEFRVEELKELKNKSEAVYDRMQIEARIGALTCGIAKIKVVGPSQAEIRERKDRIDDSWCAVRAAIKYGTLPGGGWTLLRLSEWLKRISCDSTAKGLAAKILSEAFLVPLDVLFSNAGFNDEEKRETLGRMGDDKSITFNLQEGRWVGVSEILDSAPAVLEAIRNSISVASLLGTLGGVVVFKRDGAADTQDSKEASAFAKAIRSGESSATDMMAEDLNTFEDT